MWHSILTIVRVLCNPVLRRPEIRGLRKNDESAKGIFTVFRSPTAITVQYTVCHSMFSNLVIPENDKDWHRCTWPVSCDSEEGRCIHMQLTWCQKPQPLKHRQRWCTVGRCHQIAHELLQIFVIRGSVPSGVIFSLFAIQAMISLPGWKTTAETLKQLTFLHCHSVPLYYSILFNCYSVHMKQLVNSVPILLYSTSVKYKYLSINK